MPGHTKSSFDKSIRPRCVKCGTQMRLADVKPDQSYGRRFTRQKFECPKCKTAQTYTMGTIR